MFSTASIRHATACTVTAFLFASCGGNDSYAGERDSNLPANPNTSPDNSMPNDSGSDLSTGRNRGTGTNLGTNQGTTTGLGMNPVQGREQGTKPAAGGALDARSFVEKAASSGMFEVQSAELALQQTDLGQPIQDLARTLKSDHEKANARLKDAAEEQNVKVPVAMLPEHQTMLRDLRALSGAQFETKFLEQQKKAHEEAISLFERAGRQLPANSLATFAKDSVQALRQHLDMVQKRSGTR